MSAISTCRLTVAIIARNAQTLLPGTLATARMLADEILVVDSSSGDRTAEVAKACGARVISRAWDDSFAKARNVALDHARGEWILWLDAGEQMAPSAAAELKKFVHDKADPQKVYLLAITVPPAPGNIAGEQVARVRLVPHTVRWRYVGRVCERLEPQPEACGLTLDGLPWRIHRGPRENESATKVHRARRNLTLVKLDVAERGPKPCLLVTQGEALTGLGNHTAAAAAFRQAIRAAAPTSTSQREAYYGLLTALNHDPADRQTQINVCVEALKIFPRDAQLLCALGGYMQAQNQLDLSAHAYRMAAQFGEIEPRTWHVPDIHEIATVCWSLTYQLRANDDAACRVLEEALARNDNAQRVRRHLLDVYIRRDQRKEALAQLDHLPAETPHREALRGAIRGACLAAARNWVPALAYLQAAHFAGCRDVICLRWLAAALIGSGQRDAALPILHEWLAIEPRSVEAQKCLEMFAPPVLEAPPVVQPMPSDPPLEADPRRLRVDVPEPAANSSVPAPRFAGAPTGASPAAGPSAPPAKGR
ncbi:MAG TPA: glycosyltransferase [Pirellulales bacterium]|nr:glycosyltransferase [Pirellulales bacterium]